MNPTRLPANNLNWLRLAFACQVVLDHASGHLGMPVPAFIDHFPGVPAFFFVSGLLIYDTFTRKPDLGHYFTNRFFRLFPGLLFATLGGLSVLLIARGAGDLLLNGPTYAVWFVAQITLGQAFNPDLFRGVGVGVMNGALWTITTEILFYLCVPIIVWMERRVRLLVPALIGLSFALYVLGPIYLLGPTLAGQSPFDLLALTPAVWGWMFGFGIMAAKHFDAVGRAAKYFPLAVIPLAAMTLFGSGPLFGGGGNTLGLAYFLCYVALIFWLAFRTPVVTLKDDFSYGVYVWHMPMINLALVIGGGWPLAVGLTALFAVVSWFAVERPAERLKMRLRSNTQSPAAAPEPGVP